MEKAFVLKDMKSFEFSSPSELDRRFYGEQSLLSALSQEQLSTSRASNDTLADGSNVTLSILASLCSSSDPITSPQAFSINSLNAQDTDSCQLAVPLQGNSSTPYMHIEKQKSATRFDQSCNDLGASQMSWDLSLIKYESNSPKPCMESNALEAAWSPKPESTKNSLPEVSP
ncbi:hypothetical protein Q5P01_002125 [Channa striata]|uniref:Uncharacterized protein n=1 Tax=Channa striata TaxID=64152 RepID=A0AA88T4J0_CHASR|nr:hypothetical protein Q5P01_002125 [Channa striata]